MTISTTTSRNNYAGSGSAGPFSFGFKVFAAADLLVTKRDADDIETTLSYPADFSVTGIGVGAGGSITLTTDLESGETLAIRRSLALVQETDIRNQGSSFRGDFEDALDRLTMVDQQQQDELGRSVRLGESYDPDYFDLQLPPPEAGTALIWNVAGTGFDNAALSDVELSEWSASHNHVLDVFTSGVHFTAGSTTQLSLSATPGSEDNLIVVRRTSGANVIVQSDEYSLSGQTLTFSVAIPVGTTRVEVRYFHTYQINVAHAQNVDYSQAGTGAVSTDVRTELRRVVWAENYGAVADDSTDNTAFFQAAADYLDSIGGGILNVGPGIFRTNQFSIGDKTWIRMSDATVLKCTSSTAARGIITNAGGSGGNSYLRVTGGQIQRTVTNGNSFFDLVFFQNSSFIWIDGVRGIGAGTTGTSPTGNKGFTLDGCTYYWMENNYLKNIPDNSLASNWTGSRSNGYGFIRNNTIELTGVDPAWQHSAIVVTADNATIDGNRYISAGAGSYMVEAGDDVRDLLITNNDCGSRPMLIALSGGRFAVHGNRSNMADGSSGTIRLSSNLGDSFGHVIGNNPGCRVSLVKEGVGTFVGVDIAGFTGPQVAALGVTDLTVRGCTASNPDGNGFQFITCQNLTVLGNTAHGCQSVTNPDTGHGFYYERCNTSSEGISKGNVSYGNELWGYYWEQPQNQHWIDDDGWDNTAGFTTVNNATLQGPIPFLNVRYKGTGAPGFYGNPGSEYWRTDGDDKAAPVRYTKTSANTSSGGWAPMQTSGSGGDTAAAVTTTLPAGRLHRITGATTITSITAAYAGRVVTLTSDGGGHSMTDGSNLKLAGNWTTPGDSDSITLACDGTNWIECGRSNN